MKGNKSARAKASDKGLETLLRQVEQQGCVVTGGGSRHFKIKVPGKGMVVSGSTNSCRRAADNTRSRLRRFGVAV